MVTAGASELNDHCNATTDAVSDEEKRMRTTATRIEERFKKEEGYWCTTHTHTHTHTPIYK